MVVSQGAALVPSQGGTNPASFGKAEPLHLMGKMYRVCPGLLKAGKTSTQVPVVLSPRPNRSMTALRGAIVSRAHSAPQDSQAATRMSIYNPALSPIEEPSAQEWGKEADEAFSLMTQLWGISWLGSAAYGLFRHAPPPSRLCWQHAGKPCAKAGAAGRGMTLPAGGFACQHGGGTSMPGHSNA